MTRKIKVTLEDALRIVRGKDLALFHCGACKAEIVADIKRLIEGHPHDGYAYDGCSCVCCLNVRALNKLPNFGQQWSENRPT